MAKYIINKNQQDSDSGKNYEVHNVTVGACGHLPLFSNQIDLGLHPNCQNALAEAKRRYPAQSAQIDGCYYCCENCHRG